MFLQRMGGSHMVAHWTPFLLHILGLTPWSANTVKFSEPICSTQVLLSSGFWPLMSDSICVAQAMEELG